MLRISDSSLQSPIERFGLSVLVDLSRVLPIEDAHADVVHVAITDEQADGPVVKETGRVTIPREVLMDAARTVGLVAEQQSTEEDRHGRVPASANALARQGLERQPVVSSLAASLRRAVQEAAGRRPFHCLAPWPHGHRWAAAITHDVDLVDGWGLLTLARLVELGRHGEWRRARSTIASAFRALPGHPIQRDTARILELESRHDIRASWFFLCGEPTIGSFLAKDLTYSLGNRRVSALLGELQQRRHEIGLHGSLETARTRSAHREQKAALEGHLDTEVQGVRQHFLRMRPGASHRDMVYAGFRYDASLGFADRAGFRLGVADVVPVWEEATESVLPLDAVPLLWMDRTASKYDADEDPEHWVSEALAMAAVARDHEGLWVGLWHPYLGDATGFPGAMGAFEHLLDGLAADAPWFARLDAVVKWRRFRRSVRATRIGPDGVPLLQSDAEGEATVTLEDAEARSMDVGVGRGGGA